MLAHALAKLLLSQPNIEVSCHGFEPMALRLREAKPIPTNGSTLLLFADEHTDNYAQTVFDSIPTPRITVIDLS